jgi:phage terminase large subunit-like protein
MPSSSSVKIRGKDGSGRRDVDPFFPNALSQRAASSNREKKPFTVPHFKVWAKNLTLDNGKLWVAESFQCLFLKDLFSGIVQNLLVIPEGNAKTTFLGGLLLYHLEFKKHARVPVAASSRDQAEWLYQAAAGFVERAELQHTFTCLEGYRRIRCDSTGSRAQIFAATDRTGDGIVPTLAILEELHRHKNLDLYRTWSGKMEKRGGQLIAISTAGEPDGEFEALRKKMRDDATSTTRDGAFLRAVGPDYVLHEYALPEDGDPDDFKQVKAANPLKTITVASLKRKRALPDYEPSHWRRFTCGQPARLESVFEPKVWDELKWDVGNVAEGDEVYISVRVATGVGIGIASPRGEKVAVKLQTIPRPASGRVPLWKVEAALRELARQYEVLDISYDADQFLRPAEILEEEGLPMSEVPQRTRRLSQATSTLWRYYSGGLLGHDGDLELRSQVLAARTKETIEGWHLDPEPSSAGVIAVAMALHQASEAIAPEPMFVLPSGVA